MKNIEIVEYLHKSNTLVFVYSNKNPVSKAYDTLAVTDASMAVLTFTLENSHSVTANQWKLLHLLTFKRGNPITQVYNQKLLGFFGSKQVKKLLPCPVIDATHNPEGIQRLFILLIVMLLHCFNRNENVTAVLRRPRYYRQY